MKSVTTLLALLLIGSAPMNEASSEDLRVREVYPHVTKAEAWQSVMAGLSANDLPVTSADFERGNIRVRQHNYLDNRWAACPNIDRLSFDPLSPVNINIRSAPLYRGVDLRLEITETATGTQLALDPRYSDVGRDYGRRAFAFQVRCRSTGVLEQILFTAVGKP